jgi:hypothetical protein
MKEKNSKKELEYISNKLKETHVAQMTSLINYESETQSKFKKPILNDKNRIKLNTTALQESNLNLGRHNVP